MLLNNFFFIDSLQQNDTSLEAEIHINTEHEILKGHFPNQPVVPGVCMTEMLREVIQESIQQKLQLESASMIKFLTMFSPPQFTKAKFSITYRSLEENKLDTTASLQFEEHVFLKFRGVFKLV